MTSTQQRPARRTFASAGSLLRVAAVTALLLPALIAVSASSADAASYRYWSFWTTDGNSPWNYSNVGAASTRPVDGDVQGWRFAVSGGASSSTITPRTAGSFDALCGDQPKVADRKRVGLVVDFGTRADAPPGEEPPTSRTFCVLAPVKASGAAVLLQALSVRTKDGLVCGIDGYPRSECAVVVRDVEPEPTSSATPSASRQPSAKDRATRVAPGNANASPQRTIASSVAPTTPGRPASTPSAGASVPTQTGSSPEATVIGDTEAVLVVSGSGSGGSPWGVVAAAILLAMAAGTAAILKRRAS